jgi:hypothetical protein
LGVPWSRWSPEAETITVTKDDTVILGGAGNKDDIQARTEQIEA